MNLDIFPIHAAEIRAVYECKALEEKAGLPVKPGEKPSLKSLAKALQISNKTNIIILVKMPMLPCNCTCKIDSCLGSQSACVNLN